MRHLMYRNFNIKKNKGEHELILCCTIFPTFPAPSMMADLMCVCDCRKKVLKILDAKANRLEVATRIETEGKKLHIKSPYPSKLFAIRVGKNIYFNNFRYILLVQRYDF